MMAAFSGGFYESHGPTPSGHHHDHQNGQQSGNILHLLFVCCRPGGLQGETQPVVAQWRHLVAFMKALVMLHQAMPHVPLHCLRTAIEFACDRGAFVHHRRLFCLV